MKTLNVQSMAKSRQKGFTIIELIVVILLLGILTATALPRFLDVTDQAHRSVFDATMGAFATGVALAHAQFIAAGEDITDTFSQYGGTQVSDEGYPVGVSVGADVNELDENTECLNIYSNLLQSGAPVIAEDTAITTTATAISTTTLGNAVTITSDADFVAQFTATDICTYAYVGQHQATGQTPGIYNFTYNIATGVVAEGTVL